MSVTRQYELAAMLHPEDDVIRNIVATDLEDLLKQAEAFAIEVAPPTARGNVFNALDIHVACFAGDKARFPGTPVWLMYRHDHGLEWYEEMETDALWRE